MLYGLFILSVKYIFEKNLDFKTCNFDKYPEGVYNCQRLKDFEAFQIFVNNIVK